MTNHEFIVSRSIDELAEYLEPVFCFDKCTDCREQCSENCLKCTKELLTSKEEGSNFSKYDLITERYGKKALAEKYPIEICALIPEKYRKCRNFSDRSMIMTCVRCKYEWLGAEKEDTE